MSSRPKKKQSRATPDDYRQFAADCMAMNRGSSQAVQLMLAKAWDKLADQTEEWRSKHPPSAAA